MPGLVIRPVRPEDFDQWLPLWAGYNRFYGRFGDTALPQEVTEKTWSRFSDPSEPMYALVAELDDALVGLAHYLFHLSTTSVKASCYLQDLFTAEKARGRGVGTALIEEVCKAAERSDCSRVYWQTHESNDVAQRLYDQVAERTGFIVYRKLI